MLQKKPILLVLSGLACAMVATAQTSQTTGAIRGIVKAHTGQPLAETKVSIRSREAGFTRVVLTDAKGAYVLPLLPVGDYELTVLHPKMQAGKNARLRVLLGETTVQNFTLDLKEAAATVEVTAQASAVDAQQVNSTSNISAELVEAVPLRGRNFTDLVQLTPGAVSNSQGYRTAVDGARGVQNNLMIDGASFNSNFSGDTRGGTRIQFGFGLESIRELQVVTNAYDAQYGNAAGGIINAVTKTGTNEVTGMLATQLRPSGLVANMKPVPWDPAGTTNTPATLKQSVSQKEYAANIGGPIIKDVLHYFVNVDYIHSSLMSVPTDAQGTTSNYTAGDSAAQQLSAWNTFWGPSGMGNLLVGSKTGTTALQELNMPWTDDQKHMTILARLDWTVNMENHASLRVNSQSYTGLNDVYSGTRKYNIAASNNSTMKFGSTSWVAELESTFGPSIINDARFQYSTEHRPTDPNSNYPSLDLPGITMGNYYIDPRDTEEKTYQLMDTATWIHGDLTLKGGIDWQWLHYLNKFYPDGNGEIYFATWDSADWWLNSPGAAYPGANTITPSITYYQDYSPFQGIADFGEKLFATFFQASYTGLMDRRLTLSGGLRYTREMWDANPGPNSRLQGLDQMPDNGSLDPRFGFALDVNGDNRTVVRGGFGGFSSPNAAQNAASAYMNNGINLMAYKLTYAANPTFFSDLLSPSNLIQNNHLVALSAAQVQTLPASTVTLSVIDPRAKEAQARRASLEVEHDLGNGFVAKIKGLYQKTYNLQYWVNINMAQADAQGNGIPGAYYNDGYIPGLNSFRDRAGIHAGHAVVNGRNLDLSGYGDVYLSKYDGRGEYKNISFELNRLSATGFAFTSSLTLSSSRDTNSNENSTAGSAGASPTDPSNPLLMARSDNDTPVRFVLGGKLPPFKGFFLSGTFTWTSGLPYSPIYNGGGVNSDVNGDNLYNDYALGGRNSFRQPYRKTFDLALTRSFYLYEGWKLDLTAQLFNVFNWANQTVGTNYNATYYANVPAVAPAVTTPLPNFGKVTVPDQNTRQAQFNIKLTF